MIIHKCDCCGKEMTVWVDITNKIEATDDRINVANLLQYQGHLEVCPECYARKAVHK